MCFRMAIGWVQMVTLGSAPHPGQLRLLLIPTAVGLLVAALVQLVFPAARGSGVNQTKAALYIYNGYISFRTVIGKFLTSALAIGGGFSLGPEDPSLQLGAGVASIVSRRLTSRANGCACSRRSAPRPDWRRHSTRPFRPFCLSSKR